jgi:hypothetical protein
MLNLKMRPKMNGVGSISDAQAFTYLITFVASSKVTF